MTSASRPLRPRRSALGAYTVTNAWAAGEEAVKGTVAPGKLADLAVVARDPFSVPPAEIKDLRVVLTVVGGRIVFEETDL